MGPFFSLIRLYSPALEIIDGVMCEGWISVALKDKKKIQAMATITEKILYYNLYYLCIENWNNYPFLCISSLLSE